MFWKIVKKTGYHGALGLLLLVPIANIIMLAVLAFKEWPIQKESKAGEIKSSKPLATPLIALIVIVAIVPTVALLAAIVLPNFLKARAASKEASAKAAAKTISTDIIPAFQGLTPEEIAGLAPGKLPDLSVPVVAHAGPLAQAKPQPSPVYAESAQEHYNRGLTSFAQGEFTQAIADFTRAIEIDPNLTLAYSNRGLAYLKQGDFPQAISDFTKAIEINPDDSDTYSYRGIAYLYQGEISQAISDFTKAIELTPDSAEAYSNRATAYLTTKEYDLAWIDVHKAEELGYALDPEFITKLKEASGRDK